MQENNNSEPLGICHRLFNFIMNSLIAPGVKLLTTGHSLPDHQSNKMSFEDSSTNQSELSLKHATHNGEKSVLHADWERPIDRSSSEIMVEFRHTNGVEQWTLDRVPKKDSPPVIRDFPKLQKGMENRNSVQGIFQEEENIEKKYAKIPIDQKLKGVVVETDDKRPSYRPLILMNINEKSDAFIRQKREALMRTNNSLDQS
ncbi:hypothetical protein LOK49_LG15G00403 [Camellia lanceoleosa]|uniref:Uncharacterized protein n=1 Tax=Camellia lanceoleosa TaxID=1840588 RepID=A0ACC0F6Z6_9ERIC|nr:hypothetical protein LOK49_LG15G00403 [Camellia lanceoleosa]